MKFARIIDGAAVDVIATDPFETFHPDLAGAFVEVPAQVETGWTTDDDGETWEAPNHVEVAPPAAPKQLAIIYFLRLFTTAELASFNALQAVVRALTPADYQAAAAGDQAKAALVGFGVFLTYYEALRNGLIELDDADTIQGLSLLVPLGVLTAPRLAQVLAGEAPA